MLTTKTGLHDGRARRLRLTISCLLVSCALLGHRGAEAQGNGSADRLDPAIARTIVAFYTAWLGRDLRDDEKNACFREDLADQRRKGLDAARAREQAKQVDAVIPLLRKQEGTPEELRLRRAVLAGVFFEPGLENTTQLKLLNEPDPVRFFDPNTRKIMTEGDVIALAQLIVFAHSSEGPRPTKMSFGAAEEFVRERLCDLSKCGVSEFFSEAAILWAGIRRHWPRLSANEKREARTYVQTGWGGHLRSALGSKLLGIDQSTAFNRWSQSRVNRQLGYSERLMKQSIMLDAMRGK